MINAYLFTVCYLFDCTGPLLLPVDSLVAVTFPAAEHRLLCTGFSSSSPWAQLWLTGPAVPSLQQLQPLGSAVAHRARGAQPSAAATQGLSCSAACGIFPDQGRSSGFLRWQVNSYPLFHQGSPINAYLIITTLSSSVQSLSHVLLCDSMNRSTPGLPVHHKLPEFTQTHIH